MTLVVSLLLILTAPSETILGTWYNTDRSGKIEIFKVGDEYFGKIVWLEEPFDDNGNTAMDSNNPDRSIRNTPLVGLVVMKDFEYKGNGQFDSGKIYDPENGKTYKCKLTLRGDELDVRGYIGIPALGRTETWSRVY